MQRGPVVYCALLPGWIRESIPEFFSEQAYVINDQLDQPLDHCNQVTRLFKALNWPLISSPPTEVSGTTLKWLLGPFSFVIKFLHSGKVEVSIYRDGVGFMAARWLQGYIYDYGYLTLDQVRRAWIAIASHDLVVLETIYASYELTHTLHRDQGAMTQESHQ